ncbi:MAG: hypothetical protein ACRAVC_11685, partial [Trichormus sp.]
MVSPSSKPQLPENVTVIIEINHGSFVDGFAVKLQILEDGLTIQDDDNLPNIPPAPEIPQLYEDWKNISLENSGQNIPPENNRQLQAVPVQVTNVASRETWRNIVDELENACRRWFEDHT